MRDAIASRGPDDAGLWEDAAKGVAIAHRRLAILDIAGGKQPFASEDESVILTYNGEIYNHLELRDELEKLGHIFKTRHSDTETVLHSYMEWGENAPARFNGMFALAVYDKRKNILFMARDRFGEKPLFWTQSSLGFAFASDIKAFFPWPGFNAAIDTENIQRYFAWGYFSGNRTLYKDTYSLYPGSWLKLDITTGSCQEHRYWRFNLEPDNSLTNKDEPRLIEELRHLIDTAIQKRLLSDVPLGVFLSGGIDSSTILDGMCRVLPAKSVQAFTIGFTEKSFDESLFASEVAQHYGVDHNIRTLDMMQAQELIPDLFSSIADPLGDASLLPTSLLAQFTREHVTVALSGDGGDELFAGYDPFKALLPACLYSKFVPKPIHSMMRKMACALPITDSNMNLGFKIRRTLRGLSYPQSMWLPVWMSPVEPDEIIDLFESPLSAEELYVDALDTWNRNRHLDIQDQALAFFTEHYLSNDILVKTDRATMLHSLESRAVFLDNDLVSFCQKLPFHFKMRNGNTKYLLKKAVEGRLPKPIINRRKKGFGIPLNRWARNLNILTQNKWSSTDIQFETISRCVDSLKQKKGDYALFLWAWAALSGSISKNN